MEGGGWRVRGGVRERPPHTAALRVEEGPARRAAAAPIREGAELRRDCGLLGRACGRRAPRAVLQVRVVVGGGGPAGLEWRWPARRPTRHLPRTLAAVMGEGGLVGLCGARGRRRYSGDTRGWWLAVGRAGARRGRGAPHTPRRRRRGATLPARRGEGWRGARVSKTHAGARKCRPARRWWRTGVLAPPASPRRRAVAATLRPLLFGRWFCAGRRGGRGSEKRAFGWARVVPAPSPHLRRPSLRVGSPWPVHNDRRTTE